jgi:hypothetical protein
MVSEKDEFDHLLSELASTVQVKDLDVALATTEQYRFVGRRVYDHPGNVGSDGQPKVRSSKLRARWIRGPKSMFTEGNSR